MIGNVPYTRSRERRVHSFLMKFVILQNRHFNRHRFQTLTGNKSNMGFLGFVQKLVFGNIARQSPDRNQKTTISLPGFVLKGSLVK